MIVRVRHWIWKKSLPAIEPAFERRLAIDEIDEAGWSIREKQRHPLGQVHRNLDAESAIRFTRQMELESMVGQTSEVRQDRSGRHPARLRNGRAHPNYGQTHGDK